MKDFIELSVAVRWFLFIVCASSVVLGAIENGEQKKNGYDCGRVQFTDQMVQETLKVALDTKAARPYVGPLYDVDLGYMTWPIILDELSLKIKKVTKSNLGREAMYQVIFDTNGKVIDVIVKIRNYDFVKCWRVGNSESEIQSFDIDDIYGYYCGQRFITRDDLKFSLEIARSKLGEGFSYPALYVGHLYNRELGFMIWPIYRGLDLYRNANSQGGPYYMVINPEGQFKDVIVRTACHDEYYVKCMMSKNILPPSSTTAHNKAITKSSKTGFNCDGIFFDDNELDFARSTAKRTHETGYKNTYPSLHKGPPFDSTCYLWPLRAFGRRSMLGKAQPYRLVLSLDFDIMCVAVQSGGIIKKCERMTILGSHSQQDQNNYQCQKKLFTHQDLVSAAKAACAKLGSRSSSYPQKYTGLEFDVPGPYFIYPIIGDKIYKRSSGKHRLVMSYNCLVAGALTMDSKTGELVKCRTLKTTKKLFDFF